MRTWLSVAAAGAMLAGPALAADGGMLTIRLNSDIRNLEPGGVRDSNTDTVIHTVFEGLVAHRADLSVGGALAKSWTVEDGGKAYRFTLRDGVTFHNGAPLTSAEVKWTWDRMFNGDVWKCKSNYAGRSGINVTAVEAPDPKTVVYRLEQPNALFLKQLANVQCQVLVAHPDSAGADGKWKEPIGTGPYRLKEWKRDDRIVLDRFDGYSPSPEPGSAYAGARKAMTAGLTFMIVPDQNAAEAALETGAIDIMPDIESDRIKPLKAKGMAIGTADGLPWSPILIQTRDPLLSNVKLRRALAHAIDADQIAEAETDGLTKGNPSAVSRSSAYFDEKFLAWPEYDPAKAAALAKEAGYKGEEIVLQSNKKYTDMYDRSVIVQAMLSAAGFNVKLEVMDWATQLDNYLKGAFQLQSFGYSARLDPGLLYATFIGDKDKLKSAQWESKEAIELVAKSSLTEDEAERKAIFLKLHAMMAEEVPVIPLYFSPVIDAVRPNVKGYQSWAAGKPIPWGVTKE